MFQLSSLSAAGEPDSFGNLVGFPDVWLLRRFELLTFILWCILFVLCWPIALLALALYPSVWLLLLPFRLIGITVEGVLKLLWAIVILPARLVSSPGRS
jgi:hypothetical protein